MIGELDFPQPLRITLPKGAPVIETPDARPVTMQGKEQVPRLVDGCPQIASCSATRAAKAGACLAPGVLPD